jgi:pilus assembly protein Flp/PilA
MVRKSVKRFSGQAVRNEKPDMPWQFRCHGISGPQELCMRALMSRLVSRFLADQSGATSIEYCLIAAGLSIVIVTVVNGIGTQLNTKYTSVSGALQ